MNKHGIFLVCLLSAVPSMSVAQNVTWSGQVQTDGYDCKLANKAEIVVDGPVTLLHPMDKDAHANPRDITIDCEKLTFKPGSSLSSMSNLDIRISGLTTGPVRIISTRNVRGDDAKPTPEIWGVRKLMDGGPVGEGRHGDNANCNPLDSHTSEGGWTGPRGNDGETGLHYAAPKGESGRSGTTSADVVLLSGSFGPGTTIEVTAIGGDGGAGGRGGRGANGGDGGTGGVGGHGGDGCETRDGSNGGTGGRGGDGGDGGNGGPGGDGGDGGNGGSVTVGLLEGAGPAPTPKITNRGGTGGDPGLGGERGEGGKKGVGGPGGCGGSGSKLGFGRPGDCAGKGQEGLDGRPGLPGPIGQRGKDGQKGRIGSGFVGTLPKEAFEKLIKRGS